MTNQHGPRLPSMELFHGALAARASIILHLHRSPSSPFLTSGRRCRRRANPVWTFRARSQPKKLLLHPYPLFPKASRRRTTRPPPGGPSVSSGGRLLAKRVPVKPVPQSQRLPGRRNLRGAHFVLRASLQFRLRPIQTKSLNPHDIFTRCLLDPRGHFLLFPRILRSCPSQENLGRPRARAAVITEVLRCRRRTYPP